MDLTAPPFNQFVGFRKSEQKDVLLKLFFSPKVGNHPGGLHAGPGEIGVLKNRPTNTRGGWGGH
jgi:hypothetical protein